MALNLIRNARVFFSSNVDSTTGKLPMTQPVTDITTGIATSSTAGAFSYSPANTVIAVGNLVTITGTNTGTGSITGYASGTIYRISAATSGTGFTLTTVDGTALVTVAGTLIGLTFSFRPASGFTTTNTAEIQVLDGFSFSQNSNAETVSTSEAGDSPVRGQRSFNTSLSPVDFSFSTYIRPFKANSSADVTFEEQFLWNAFYGTTAITTTSLFSATPTAASWTASTQTLVLTVTLTAPEQTELAVGSRVVISGLTNTTASFDNRAITGPATVTAVSGTAVTFRLHNLERALSSNAAFAGGSASPVTTLFVFTNLRVVKSSVGLNKDSSIVSAHASNVNQLQKFALLVTFDSVQYAINNCVLTEATIDFGLDGIATISWTGQASSIEEIATAVTATTGSTGTFGAGAGGSFAPKITAATFLSNKLSTCRLKTVTTAGTGTAGAGYYLALTGGSITLSNNVSYVTPAVVGVVNSPLTYYTGARTVSGTLNAYLNTGTVNTTLDSVTYPRGTGALLKDILANSATASEPMFYLELTLGGKPSDDVRVELQMPGVSLSVPAVNTEQVISVAINFAAAPSSGSYASGATSTRIYDIAETNELTLRYFSKVL